jgi:hypothetical protein
VRDLLLFRGRCHVDRRTHQRTPQPHPSADLHQPGRDRRGSRLHAGPEPLRRPTEQHRITDRFRCRDQQQLSCSRRERRETLSCLATCRYSWSRPPRRSRRTGGVGRSGGGGVSCPLVGVDVAILGARAGVRIVRISASATTASKAEVNLLSRSRMRKRNWVARSPRSMTKFRACWVTQAPVGWAGIPRYSRGGWRVRSR